MYSYFKRFFDFLSALILLLLISPVFIVVFVLQLLFFKGSPFFVQCRPGRADRLFQLVKFKTMNDNRGLDGELLPDADRVTPFGLFLRKTSLDELPQLWNVLIGDMSLVGPRPLLVQYLPLYNDEQKRRHEVRPGITGWAQVNGRNAISWEQKFKADVWYVDNQSLWLDLKILYFTIIKVIRREGITDVQGISMAPFKGNTQS